MRALTVLTVCLFAPGCSGLYTALTSDDHMVTCTSDFTEYDWDASWNGGRTPAQEIGDWEGAYTDDGSWSNHAPIAVTFSIEADRSLLPSSPDCGGRMDIPVIFSLHTDDGRAETTVSSMWAFYGPYPSFGHAVELTPDDLQAWAPPDGVIADGAEMVSAQIAVAVHEEQAGVMGSMWADLVRADGSAGGQTVFQWGHRAEDTSGR
jgi:hypothetical protein